MRGRSIAIIAVLLLALASTTSMEARRNGANLDSAGENGCSCHGNIDSATVITIDGLPQIYNVSEEYIFTITVENPDVPINTDEGAPHGGFRVSVENNVGTLEPVDDSALDDGGFLVHTEEGNCLLYTSDAADE